MGTNLGKCNSFLPLLEREEKALNLDDGTNMRMGSVQSGRLGSLSDAERTGRKKESYLMKQG